MRRFLLSVTVIGALVLSVGVVASSAATGYQLFGDAQLVSPGNGSATAVGATTTGSNTYGGVDFTFPAGLTVGEVNHLSTDLKSTLGTCATGTPRFAVGVDDPSATDKYLFFYPSCSSAWSSTGNLADQASLVDATQLGGGFYEPYADVQADYGAYAVTAIFLVVDTSNGSQTIQFDNSQVNNDEYTYERCTPTGFVRDGIDLTAAQIGGDVTGDLDASTCNIGVYYGPGTTGTVNEANIHGANYYGVVINAAAVNVTNTLIHDIGESPFNGSQHGVGVLYTTLNPDGGPATQGSSASGTLNGGTISRYQKNGVVISGVGAAVTVKNVAVNGLGQIDYIAQNGIQVSYGATGTITGNAVSNNYYTPKTWTACGLLFYEATGVKQSSNTFSGNETNICNAGRGGGNPRP
jgi:hypothetical protein